MYKVKYEKYRYGYGGTQEVKIFSSLEEIADWLFGMVKGKYEGSMFFVNPDDKNDKELHLDSSCISSRDDERYTWLPLHSKNPMEYRKEKEEKTCTAQ